MKLSSLPKPTWLVGRPDFKSWVLLLLNQDSWSLIFSFFWKSCYKLGYKWKWQTFSLLCDGYINLQLSGYKLNFEKHPSLLLYKLLKMSPLFFQKCQRVLCCNAMRNDSCRLFAKQSCGHVNCFQPGWVSRLNVLVLSHRAELPWDQLLGIEPRGAAVRWPRAGLRPGPSAQCQKPEPNTGTNSQGPELVSIKILDEKIFCLSQRTTSVYKLIGKLGVLPLCLEYFLEAKPLKADEKVDDDNFRWFKKS